MQNLIVLNKGSLKPSIQKYEEDEDIKFELLDSSFDILTDSITCVLGALDVGIIEAQQYMKNGIKNVLA